MSRYLNSSFLLCTVIASLLSTQPPSAYAGELPARSGIFSIRLESDKMLYRTGEPISVRVTVRNNTGSYYAIYMMPLCALCNLQVLNSQGLPVQSSGRRCAFSWGSNNIGEFPAHKSSVEEWMNIKSWGYDFDKPGNYTITATPTIVAFERTQNRASSGPSFITSAEDKSNSVHIQIVK